MVGRKRLLILIISLAVKPLAAQEAPPAEAVVETLVVPQLRSSVVLGARPEAKAGREQTRKLDLSAAK